MLLCCIFKASQHCLCHLSSYVIYSWSWADWAYCILSVMEIDGRLHLLTVCHSFQVSVILWYQIMVLHGDSRQSVNNLQQGYNRDLCLNPLDCHRAVQCVSKQPDCCDWYDI